MAIAIRSQSTPTAAASGTSIDINMPAGIQAGDYLIAFIHHQASTSTVDISSAGWTRIGASFIATDSQSRVTGMYARVATGSETSTYTFSGVGASARATGFAVAFTGVNTSNPVAHSSTWTKDATSSTTLSVSADAATAGLYTLEIWAANFSSPNSYALSSYDGGLTLIGDAYSPSGAENTGVSRSALRVWGGVAPVGGVPAHSIVTTGASGQRCDYMVSLNAASSSAPTTTPTVIGHTTAASSGATATFSVNPASNVVGGSLLTGDWIILVLSSPANAASTRQPTAPGGWTNLVPFGTVGSGTMCFGVWAHKRADGETTYTWNQTTAESQSTYQRMVFVRDADDVAEWVVGTPGTRAGSGGTVTTTAPSVTTAIDHTLALLLAGERTVAAETDGQVTCDNFTKQWFENNVDHSLFVATKDMVVSAATGTVTVTYPNTHAQNGIAVTLGIPGVVDEQTSGPAMVGAYAVDYTTTTATKTLSLTTQPGDLVVVYGGAAVGDNDYLPNPPTGNGLTFTLNVNRVNGSPYSPVYIWSAVDPVGGTNWTLSLTRVGSAVHWGYSALIFRGVDGVGEDSSNLGISESFTVLTTTRSNSMAVIFMVDSSAVDGSSRTWASVNGGNPTSGNGQETDYRRVAGAYTVYGAFYENMGSSGMYQVGVDSPAGQTFSAVALEILTPPPAPEGLPIKVSNGTTLDDAYFKLADGAGGFVTPGAYKVVRPGYSSVTQMLAQTTFYCAHRGGSLDYPEMSLYAYGQSALLGYPAFELSLARTSDGVWFGLHDSTLDRTSGVSGVTASSLTWAQVQTYNILGSVATNNPTQPNRPYMRWEEIIALYYPSHVIFVDPKVALSYHTELLAMMNALPGTPTDHFVAKYFGEGNAGGWPANARTAGYKTWGYYYAGGAWATWQHLFDILGMDYSAPSGDWTSILSYGKPVMGHIAPNAAAVATALSKGAAGVMVSGVKVNIPPAIT